MFEYHHDVHECNHQAHEQSTHEDENAKRREIFGSFSNEKTNEKNTHQHGLMYLFPTSFI